MALAEFTPETLAIMIEEATSSWHETLGVSPRADTSPARKATKLALIYHPDTGVSPEQMIRVNAAYETARAWKTASLSDRGPSALEQNVS
jgi:DnaJ-class molecular chaperone